MNLSRPIITPPEGMVSFETLRQIARDTPQARIGNVVDRLQALAVAESLRASMKPRVPIEAMTDCERGDCENCGACVWPWCLPRWLVWAAPIIEWWRKKP